MPKYYTYLHFKADSEESVPFYVGKGKDSRAWTKKSRNKHWHRIVGKHGFVVKIWLEFETEQEAYQNEQTLISYWREQGAVLANFTDGGEGLKNPSPETRSKISRAALAQWANQDSRKLLISAMSNEESKKAKSLGIKMALARPETKKKMSEAILAAKSTPESIAKRTEMSASPAYREKLSKGVKAASLRKEVKENKSKASSRRWLDTKYKENFAIKMQEMAERKWEKQGLSEEEKSKRRRNAQRRKQLLAGEIPLTKKEASILGLEARRKNK